MPDAPSPPARRSSSAGSGEPTAAEMAAIVAAVEVLWPRPVATAPPPQPPRWRFAGRWWTKPVPVRRERPW